MYKLWPRPMIRPRSPLSDVLPALTEAFAVIHSLQSPDTPGLLIRKLSIARVPAAFLPPVPRSSFLPPPHTHPPSYCTGLLCLFPPFLLVSLSPGLGGSDWVVSGSFGNTKTELPFL